MKDKRLPLSSRSILENVYAWARKAPQGVDVYSFLKSVREQLHMTQTQLARRIGIPQSHIAKIEGGKVDVQLNTLRRLFEALNCDLTVLPSPRKPPEDLLAEQAGKVAKKKVARIMGTMALEKQTPDDRTIRQMVKSEQEKLLQNPSSELWED